jgi:anaerobic magnesium-protoporphyrin IX monomethyl ester cyclase
MADDIFGLRPGWIEQFAAVVEARGSRVPYKCLLRADGVTEAVARALAASGCRTAWIGAESGSQRSVDQISEATRLLRGAGIEVAFFLQFGYPGETLEDIQRTLQMVQACAPDDIGVSISYPLPGTTFYERVKAQLGLKQNWVDSDDLAMMYRSTYPPEFYRALHRLVHAEFRVQRAWRLLRTLARSPATGNSRMVRELAVGGSHLLRLPWLRRRVDRLAGHTPVDAPPALLPVLNRQRAAAPTEQTR